MDLFTVLSKKEQVAAAIKKKIITGDIAPGTKLSSVRKLAVMFSVSTKIIIDAFDLLESEKLIKRSTGKGVFVRRHLSSNTLEVCLMGYMISPGRDVYFSDLARIAYPPYLQNGFSFITRTIPFEQGYDNKHFAHELKKLEQHLHVDCFLINAPSLNQQQVEMCIRLKMPVIFIGDFVGGLYPEVPFNQIAGDNYMNGESNVSQLVDLLHCKELTLYSGSREHYFFRRFCEGVFDSGKKLGIKINLIEIPKGTSSIPEEERNKCYYDIISSAAKKGYLECPGIDVGVNVKALKSTLALCGKTPSVYQGQTYSDAFKKFFEVIYDRIKVVSAEPDVYEKIKLKTEVKLQLI